MLLYIRFRCEATYKIQYNLCINQGKNSKRKRRWQGNENKEGIMNEKDTKEEGKKEAEN